MTTKGEEFIWILSSPGTGTDQKAARVCGKTLMPIADKIAEENKVPPEIIEEMADLGFFGIQFPENMGNRAGYTCYPLVWNRLRVLQRSGHDALS